MSAINTFSGVTTRWLGRISYEDGLAEQERLVAAREDDVILFLEHEPVYTMGRRRDQSSLKDPESLPHPIFETNRGGQATYHGPGQLVGYFIIDLAKRDKDLHKHLRAIEDLLIATVLDVGVAASRRNELTGVWVQDRKLASIGVGVRKWVTMHGFAINVTSESLEPFSHIIPCGIDNVEMTCLENEGALETPVVVCAKSSCADRKLDLVAVARVATAVTIILLATGTVDFTRTVLTVIVVVAPLWRVAIIVVTSAVSTCSGIAVILSAADCSTTESTGTSTDQGTFERTSGLVSNNRSCTRSNEATDHGSFFSIFVIPVRTGGTASKAERNDSGE